MPTYEYKCLSCEHIFEAFQKITDAPLSNCPRCLGKLQKVYYPAGIIFKGPGFYITDSRREKERREGIPTSLGKDEIRSQDRKDTPGNGEKKEW